MCVEGGHSYTECADVYSMSEMSLKLRYVKVGLCASCLNMFFNNLESENVMLRGENSKTTGQEERHWSKNGTSS